MSKNIPNILENFLNYLISIKNYSLNTIKNYQLDLMLFFNFFREYENLKLKVKEFNALILCNVKEHHIIAFLVYCNYYRDNTAQTRQRRLSSIRTFFKWLFINFPPFNANENPTNNIPNIEPVIRLPKYLNLNQAKEIQTIFTLDNTKFPYRNNMIITMFLHTGLRVSELININLSDIDFHRNLITIKGKNNKERIIYINKFLRKKLKEYIRIRNRNKKVIAINDALFLSYHGKRIGIDGVEDICEKAYKLMGLEDCGYTTHTLRHTAATLIYKKTKDLLIVKEFLGHAQISTTEIYTHVINDEIKSAIENNPLNNFSLKKVA